MPLVLSTTPQSALQTTMSDILLRTLNMMVLGYNQGMQTIWNNRSCLSPQDCFDIYSTSASGLLYLAGLNASTIGVAAITLGLPMPALTQIPAGLGITANADGTVTVVSTS